jgi:hypothetical protein
VSRARHRLVVAIAIAWAVLSIPSAAQTSSQTLRPDGIARLLRALEVGLQSGDPGQYLQLITPDADPAQAHNFATSWFETRITRASVRERDRRPVPDLPADTAYELSVDIFLEFGREGRLGTWRLDVRRVASNWRGEDDWRIAAQQEFSAVEGLHQLQLNTQQQFWAADFTITAEDLELKFPAATIFISEVSAGTTALVVMGRGEMTFAPTPEAEQGQVRIFSGSNIIKTRVDAAFVRVNPQELDDRTSGKMQARAVDARDARRASDIFSEEIGKSFALDLRDLSPDLWSTIPMLGDFVAEIQTNRHDTLTYTRFSSDPEDISLFDRRRRRTISLYPSKEKLERRGLYYSEDDLVDYDVLHYDVEARFQPDREWIDGRTGLRLAIKSAAVGSFNLRLARELTLDSVVSRQFGRLLAIRGLNQNTIIVQLPEVATRGTVLDIVVTYAGRLVPQAASREALTAGQQPSTRPPIEDATPMPAEPSWLYSNNSLWYAQSTISDYATARLQLAVPDGWTSVASGTITDPAELLPPDDRSRGITWRETTFAAAQPVRYLSWTISRFEQATETSISLSPTPSDARSRMLGMGFQKIDVHVVANGRQLGRGREVASRAVAILEYYGSILADFPYPTLTLAVVENDLPGGHSPAYFAQLHQPPPFAPVVWRNDPVFFSGFPDFFLAHELAHQWWGQAVGWRNFHEQWLSEGFAQYFAVLYAQANRPEAFNSILRQLRRWSINESDQGPVYLGYRLGHIKNDGRVFRALVYDKGAAVLHMLRRVVGDDAFFRSMRRFYTTWRFRKAGTEDLRTIVEAESKQSLERFFAGWIYGQEIPQIRFAWRVEGSQAVLTFEQLGDEVFVVPITVSLQFADRTTAEETIIVDYRTVDVRLPITGVLRSIDVNRDDAALAEFVR